MSVIKGERFDMERRIAPVPGTEQAALDEVGVVPQDLSGLSLRNGCRHPPDAGDREVDQKPGRRV